MKETFFLIETMGFSELMKLTAAKQEGRSNLSNELQFKGIPCGRPRFWAVNFPKEMLSA